ncbi:BSD domain-containing protein 1-like [Juglans microcarpa x Juglans regia]|uniref:BSD domain-containing protein 1-like n=1 Tax=Juglans microcarpa x Juglans regia TaxID=2249226 RepID=UPI001B7EF1F0|nr:BSD domain-containing protein 1-like [Juglans microcarpa x Juglans regia]
MDFFTSVFTDGPPSSDSPQLQSIPLLDDHPVPDDPNPVPSTAWSFGGFIKTFARDLEELGSGLKKETAVIREVASRAVKDLPASLDAGASVAQDSLESVGQAIDDIGSSVWKSTAVIISHGRDTLLALHPDPDSSDTISINDRRTIARRSTSSNSQRSDMKPYSRFDAQVRSIQGDMNTYLEEPEDVDRYNQWKLGFLLEEKVEEIEKLIGQNGVIGEIYGKVVPSRIDRETFWSRYFYRVHKLKQVEDARAKLVKRAISGEEEEDLSWDSDDEGEENNGSDSKVDSSDPDNVESVEVGLERQNEETGGGVVLEDRSDEKVVLEERRNSVESGRDSDISVVSSQPSPEEEDLGWDKIEDIRNSDENKVEDAVGSASRLDLHKRLGAAEEEEDLSWDIEDEDDDQPVKS